MAARDTAFGTRAGVNRTKGKGPSKRPARDRQPGGYKASPRGARAGLGGRAPQRPRGTR